ncbi:MAG: hypothetical protein KDD88_11130, partial [Rhodobacteraceae bacterium]|nr:hypothetical protein [Paracoccaceae bacterium]
GYPDLPIADRIARAEAVHADRPSQAAAEAEAKGSLPAPATPGPDFLKLIDRLRAALAEKPDDVTGQRLLARNEAALGNFAAAEAAGRKVIDLLGPKAGPNDYASLADTMILATGGYVSPEAEALLAKALALDPVNGTARFYMGLMWAQTGRPDRAFALWRALLEEGPENAPWMREIRPRIAFLARAAGVDYTAPPAPDAAPGPGAADIAAAADMSPEDRRQMIRAMVERLNARLADEGGPAEDWARLISSLTVLGETDRAAAILAEAETRFAGHDADLAKIRAAAVAQPGGAPFAGGGTALPGPDAGQVAAAGEMTPDERRTMIAGMVDQLSDRLMSEGGSAEEWARLVTSLGVLGETARAKEAYGKGRAALAGDAAGLATLEAAARAAGLAG